MKKLTLIIVYLLINERLFLEIANFLNMIKKAAELLID